MASDGGIFAYGDAGVRRLDGGIRLNQPIVGMAGDARRRWLLAGGRRTAGCSPSATRRFYGSMGGHPLNRPIVGISAAPGGTGYWLVASDGGIFDFGSAPFYGSAAGRRWSQPVVGMAATADGAGYWLVAADGGIFNYGDAQFFGSGAGGHLTAGITAPARDRPWVRPAAAPSVATA